MATELIMTVEEMDKDREENQSRKWLELRKTGIGGSDASVVVGLNPYHSLYSLWADKVGQITVDDELDEGKAELFYWGHALEDKIAERFEKDTGLKTRRKGMVRSKEHPFMIADVDREIIGVDKDGCRCILELKTTASWNKDQWSADLIPDSYFVQLQHYLCVTGADKAYIACLIGGNRFMYKEVPRNEEEIAALVEAERKFWEEYVVPKTIPAVDASDECSKLIAKFYPADRNAETLDMQDVEDDLLSKYFQLSEDMAALKKVRDEIGNKIRLTLGEHTYGQSSRYNVYYKAAVKGKFDTKKFREDYPELAEQYTNKTAVRVLRLTEVKEDVEE